jgi:hypothetical protein
MRPLSATECITPSIELTKRILFKPFRKGRTWKLSVTAYLCRFGTMFFPFPFIYLAFLPMVRSSGKGAVIALCAAVLIGTVLFVFLFHLCSRLQFAYFDIMVNCGEFVAPAWRKYGPQSRRWTGVKFLFGIGVALVFGLPIAALVRHLVPLFESMQSNPGQQPPPEFIGAIFAFYGYILLIFGPFFLVSSLLSDFIVPSLALEGTSIAESFRRMFALMRQEPGEFAIYTVLKLGLALAGSMGAMIAWEIAFLLLTLIIGTVIFVIGFVLHLVGVSTVILTVLGSMLAFAWYFFAFFYAMFFVMGTVYTFLDAYALYFLGGRYPLLGELLDRLTPPPPAPYFIPAPGNPVAPV